MSPTAAQSGPQMWQEDHKGHGLISAERPGALATVNMQGTALCTCCMYT